MAPTNMSIQTGSDRPSMKEDDHPDHNMPTPEHDGTILPDLRAKSYSDKYDIMDNGKVKLNRPMPDRGN